MSLTLPVDDWLSVLRKEYLQGFIKNGGAAVKFAVPVQCQPHQVLLERLRGIAQEGGYLFVSLDAASTKAHMIDKLFHAIAKQVAWDDLACAFLRSTLSESHYAIPASQEGLRLTELASLNGRDEGEMRRVVNNRLRDRLFRDYAMAQEFRIAMLRLCEAQLDPQELGQGTADALKEWLRGDLRLISALKSALIFQKIGRHNGRYMLSSLSHWLHLTGSAGLFLALDISRFLEARRPKEPDGSLYYSPGAVLDGYEVLRQFIDDTDELQFCLIVVLAPPSFLEPEERRGLKAYDALNLRVWDEVRDRQRPNPLSSLVRLCPQENATSPGAPGGPA